jgi:TetR/AcrR family tetracycline transcriptional repressor
MAPRKANTPTLSREQIVAAAITIVDREGLDALSMRKLAAELGVGPMSLYYHVQDKTSLYDLILDAVMSEVDFAVDDPSEPPRERVARLARAFRAALLTHPHATALAAGRSLRTATQLRPVEAMLGVMLDAGLEPTDAMRAVNVIGQFVIGTTTLHANHLTRSQYYEDRIEIDLEEFPNLLTALSGGGEIDWDADFETGLTALVDGLVPERGRSLHADVTHPPLDHT